MSVLFILPLFMAFLAGLAMFIYARQNTWRRSLITLVVATLGLPFGIMAVVLLAGVMMGRGLHISLESIAYYLTESGPMILLWFGPPMALGVLLGQLRGRLSRKKAPAA